MKTLSRVAIRGCAVVLAYFAFMTANVTVSASCYDGHKCTQQDPEEDYCWTNSTTQGNHCHIDHGSCSQWNSGSCE